MSVYMGPCNYGTPEPDSDRYIVADEPSSPANVISVIGDLDMKEHRIINMQESGEARSDAATVGYVSDWIGRLNNDKVSWSGGTMTGNLNMGTHKLKQKSDPENDDDVINKKYLNYVLHQLPKPYDLGRYIVFPHADGTETYHGAGSKRHIDLDNGKVFEIFDGDVYNPEDIIYTQFRTVNSRIENLRMYAPFSIIPDLAKPWTFIFSIQPEDPPMPRNNLVIEFSSPQSLERNEMTFTWAPGILTYIIDNQNPVRLEIESNKLYHFALEYNKKTLILWVNGVSRKTHNNLTLQNFSTVRIGLNHIGIVSIYNRDLSKLEIVEHYVKYHVKAFTNNEVLN